MKNFNLKWALVAMTALAAVACSDDDDAPVSNMQTLPDYEVSTYNVTSNMTISVDSYMTEAIVVSNNATLTIAKGVTLMAADNSEMIYILAEQGAKIVAEGTADEPIILTAQYMKPGAWGGIHLCGKATINTTGGTNSSEVGTKTYGGSDDADSSGSLTYVIIEYAGYQQSNEKECNGFTFYGVGNGTTIDHCVAYKGADDGFEWFGGTVNATNLVSIGNQDDLFDWTEGWIGSGQFWIGDQINNNCDQTIEGDNSKTDYTLDPISCPTIANVTLIGDDFSSDTSGALLRNGTRFNIYNTIASGKTTDFKLGDNNGGGEYPTDDSLQAGTSIFANVYAKTGLSVNTTTVTSGVTKTGDDYEYDQTVVCPNHGLGTVNGYAFVTAAYAGAGSFVSTANTGAGSWGAIVAAYLAE